MIVCHITYKTELKVSREATAHPSDPCSQLSAPVKGSASVADSLVLKQCWQIIQGGSFKVKQESKRKSDAWALCDEPLARSSANVPSSMS